ncbi:class I tRNA ligase family protein [archaeon]|jgi:leucyl-tRNA synthetase|nr:class I tRNA ligase family protein [archaeon]
MEIDFAKIEKKWQGKWEKEKVFQVKDSGAEKYYVLEMFPYPSGSGLHMGHAWNYTIGDILSRFKIMQGFNVLHPMGYDALGLPAENAAIEKGEHPEDYTKKSVANFTKQFKSLGISYDWSRMVNSSDPSYYKWDQWIFLKMLEKGLAYQKESEVNWCDKCNTVLANEQVHDGKCWRHDKTDVETRKLKQWFFKTTEYADELYEGLDKMDWPERTKAMQKNWIGKSHGTEIDFEVEGKKWSIFTTRPDTIFGVTFMVVSAQHAGLDELVTDEQRKDVDKFLKKLKSVSEKDSDKLDKEGVFSGSYAINPANGEKIPVWIGNFVVADYGAGMVMAVPAHDQRDFDFAKKYGIEVRQVIAPYFCDKECPPREGKRHAPRTVVQAIVKHPKENKIIQIQWKKFDWNTFVIGGAEEGETLEEAVKREVYEETGYKNIKSIKKIGFEMRSEWYALHKDENRYAYMNAFFVELSDLKKDEIADEEKEKHVVAWVDFDKVRDIYGPVSELNYICDALSSGESAYTNEGKLVNSDEFNEMNNVDAKDKITKWLAKKKAAKKVVNFKLRDWGVSRQRYWGTPIPVIHCEKCGAVPVPEKDLPVKLPKDVKFGKGNPLETNEKWLNVKCPKCAGKGKRESDTMDTFVNSSWYFLRYCDPNNSKKIFDAKKVKYWCPVDTYIGGAEHACMHLIYSRFYVKFLRDLGLVDFDEPAVKLFHQGMLHGEDGEKMSKSKGNGVLPEEVSGKYGIDTARFFLSGIASPDKDIDWSNKGINGSLRFVNKVVDLCSGVKIGKDSDEVLSKLNETVKNVSSQIDTFDYRTATIRLKELFDLLAKQKEISKVTLESALKMLAPFCPHVAEELWEKVGNKDFISKSNWPKFDESKVAKKGQGGDLNEKIIEDVNRILEKVADAKKVYVYVMPFELAKVDVKKVGKVVGKVVEVFAVNDSGKHDPEGKAKRAKPGKASVYVE